MLDNANVTPLETMLDQIEKDPTTVERIKTEHKGKFVIVSKAEIDRIMKLETILDEYVRGQSWQERKQEFF
jgi:hypothetical protein